MRRRDRPDSAAWRVIQAAAIRFEDQAGYIATVLAGAHVAHPVSLAPAESTGITVTTC
jgi:hypothetical protein